MVKLAIMPQEIEVRYIIPSLRRDLMTQKVLLYFV